MNALKLKLVSLPNDDFDAGGRIVGSLRVVLDGMNSKLKDF